MRTTLTLGPDVARAVKERMRRELIPMKQVVNEALRRGLAESGGGETERFRVEPHSFGIRAGIDQEKLNQLADELEAAEFAARNRSESE